MDAIPFMFLYLSSTFIGLFWMGLIAWMIWKEEILRKKIILNKQKLKIAKLKGE